MFPYLHHHPHDSKVIPSLLQLPTELVLKIIEHLSPRDLYSLALLSRRLHFLCLPLYFHHYSIDISSEALSLYKESLVALPGLLIYLPLTSLKQLLYTFNVSRDGIINEALDLHHLIQKLSIVEEVTLSVVPVWPARPIISWGSSREWEQALLSLFKISVEKSCRSLIIHWKGSDPESFEIHARLEKGVSFNRPVSAFKKAFSSIKGKGSRTENTFRPKPTFALQTFETNSLVPFLPHFWSWTVETLNASIITKVSFISITTPNNWSQFLPWMTLPHLTDLSITASHIPFPDLLHFLNRHPLISALDLCNSSLEIVTLSPPLKGTLPHLVSFSGNPQHVLYFLSVDGAYPNISNIRLASRTVGGVHYDLRFMDVALSVVAKLRQNITLSIEIINESGLVEWLEVDNTQARHEHCLHCVKSLHFGTKSFFVFSHHILNILPKWLALFPALEHLVFTGECLPVSYSGDTLQSFVSSVSTACPGLKTLEVANTPCFYLSCEYMFTFYSQFMCNLFPRTMHLASKCAKEFSSCNAIVING